jgi:predicted enzyme related to lactoylglutathione lyase
MDLQLHTTFITVDDHDRAIAFYRDVLGLTLTNDVAYGGSYWVTMTAEDHPEVSIVLEPPGADPNTADADRNALRELMAKGLLARAIFSCDDVDKTFAQIEAAGADVVQEPMDMPYGVRDCAFRDPFGNLIRINQRG